MNFRGFRLGLVCSLSAGIGLAWEVGAQELKTGNSADAPPRTPAEEQRSFTVPPRFTVELVASEETGLPKPVSIAFDDSGRMWAVTATEYPRDQDTNVWNHPGRDRVVVFDAPAGPGPHTARTFAEGMVMPMSVLPYRDGALVAQGPEILFLQDINHDGRADRRTVLLKGFGVQDTHTLPHQLEFFPGNWIVFSQGVLNTGTAITTRGKQVNFDRTVVARFRPDGSDLEILGTGLNNIWCWVQDRQGQVFIHEANDFGYSVVPFEQDTSYPSFIKRLVHPDSPYHPPTAPNLSLGGTGFSGLALSDDSEGSFPPPWHDVLFVANPITRRINAVRVTLGRNEVYHFEPLPDLLSSNDDFFRPVAIRFGPDGCLYIVDWYNRIISHNEIDRNHPARDKTRGRVWRVRHESQSRKTPPDVASVPTTALMAHLQAPGTWEMRAAWHQIVQRNARELIPELAAQIRRKETRDDVRIAALWALEGLGYFDAPLWKALLESTNASVRFEAVRALSSVQPPLGEVYGLLQPLSEEPTHRVRHEVIRYFRDCPEPLTPSQIAWLERWRTKPDLSKTVKGWDRDYLQPGGVYEDAFQNLLLQMITEKGRPRPPAPTSSRWSQVLNRRAPRSDGDRQRMADRISQLRTRVDSAPAPDLGRGQVLFQSTCAGCHSVRGDGTGFGPSLSGSRNRTTEAVLTAVLDPNQAVESAFRIYHVETADGESYDGFFGEETPDALTVRFAGGTQQVIPVRSIRSAGYIDGQSVMPEGLLDGLSEEQVIDLVRYVRSIP
ncbi:MAG: PVC-type heme-binding CxxCH protein [Verrucomicrobiota bacterium]